MIMLVDDYVTNNVLPGYYVIDKLLIICRHMIMSWMTFCQMIMLLINCGQVIMLWINSCQMIMLLITRCQIMLLICLSQTAR